VLYTTERLTVREWTADPADVDRIFDIYSRWEVARWLGAAPKAMSTRDEAASLVDRWHAFHVESGGRYGDWAIQAETKIAGTVLFKPLPGERDEIEVGWHLHPDSWGNGYATEAARGAIERGFASGLTEVFAVVYPGNTASIAVCHRLGMTPLGRTSKWYGVELEAFRKVS